MKNVTKILTAVVLCAALFASDQRINALGGNAALWPGDEANIGLFPGSINDHAYVQLTGIGDTYEQDATTGLWNAVEGDKETATILFDKDGTKWGFGINNQGEDWFNIMWGNGDMGLSIGMLSNENGATGSIEEASGFNLGWGQTMGFGDLGVTYSSTSMTSDWADADPAGPFAGSHLSTVTDKTHMGVNYRGDVGFWVFDGLTASLAIADHDAKSSVDDGSSVSANPTNEVGDMSSTTLSATAFTHMDAGGADVLFALGVENMSGDTVVDADGDDLCDAIDPNTGVCKMTDVGHMHLNTTVAVEANMTDWATFRVGATYAYQLSGENDWTGAGGSSAGTGWALGTGLGFNWGGFSADYTITDGFFNDPVSSVTGYDEGKLTHETVTLSYRF